MENQPSSELIYKFIDHFKPIYGDDGSEINPMPENEKITVYCEGSSFEERGFLDDVTTKEMGLGAFIAKKWISQSELEALLKAI